MKLIRRFREWMHANDPAPRSPRTVVDSATYQALQREQRRALPIDAHGNLVSWNGVD